ncbi:MAG: glycoside hydrolase family 15 protein [Chloroflexi bacterium]|nr:glycoside hydrolase family 15 protein [Chloroflexota bacterium]
MYLRIEDHGIIGDLYTAALVGVDGTIDWFCAPHFDSPSIFASILDEENGGHFSLRPANNDVRSTQYYLPETNVLVTHFTSDEGVAQIVDFMPVRTRVAGDTDHVLIRRITGIRGNLHMQIDCSPRFNYGRDEHDAVYVGESVRFISPDISIEYWSTVKPKIIDNAVKVDFEIQEGHTEYIVIDAVEHIERADKFDAERIELLFDATVDYWRRWINKCTYTGRWREMVHRSALILKLLTYEPTGAFVAAPTTSLPEHLGGVRNWDYRYTWIRDAAFSVYGLLRIGLTEEAGRFMEWLEARCAEAEEDGTLRIMYGIDGSHDLEEHTLDHLSGYMGSQPVRIGNGAADQLQLDIYGELMDAVYLSNKYQTPISYDFWTYLRKIINWVCDNWHRADEGIWEVRGGRAHFVYSKLMCWVAIDRGIRLAAKRSFPSDTERWVRVRDEIYEQIIKNGWSDNVEAFTQAYGRDALDASNLIMPMVFFMSPSDPRMLKTLDAIQRSPSNGGLVYSNLVYRYNLNETADGLEGEEGTFNMCTFWLVEALTRAGRSEPARLEEARMMFEHMLGYANHLGLYSEEIGPKGEHLGNFPQAFTHLALISAAFNLDRALGSRA